MITMARFRWSGLRLPVVLLLLRPFLVAVIMLLSELLMTPGLGRDLLQSSALAIGDRIVLLLSAQAILPKRACQDHTDHKPTDRHDT